MNSTEDCTHTRLLVVLDPNDGFRTLSGPDVRACRDFKVGTLPNSWSVFECSGGDILALESALHVPFHLFDALARHSTHGILRHASFHDVSISGVARRQFFTRGIVDQLKIENFGVAGLCLGCCSRSTSSSGSRCCRCAGRCCRCSSSGGRRRRCGCGSRRSSGRSRCGTRCSSFRSRGSACCCGRRGGGRCGGSACRSGRCGGGRRWSRSGTGGSSRRCCRSCCGASGRCCGCGGGRLFQRRVGHHIHTPILTSCTG